MREIDHCDGVELCSVGPRVHLHWGHQGLPILLLPAACLAVAAAAAGDAVVVSAVVIVALVAGGVVAGDVAPALERSLYLWMLRGAFVLGVDKTGVVEELGVDLIWLYVS